MQSLEESFAVSFHIFHNLLHTAGPTGPNSRLGLTVMTSARGRAGHIANRWESCGLHLQRKEGWWGNKASKSVGVQVCRISTALSGDKRAGEHLTLAEREETVRERFL